MTEDTIRRMNTTSLAYLGDAVYEIRIREMIIAKLSHDVSKAHRTAIHYVSAESQAKAARVMMSEGFLTEEEEALLKRARNHRTMSKPQHASAKDYKLATGFEAVMGYLHLMGREERINEISAEAVRIIESRDETEK